MDDFYNGLTEKQKEVFDLYKSNGPFLNASNFTNTLNEGLSKNSLSTDWQLAVEVLDSITAINKLTDELIVYRSTSLEIINNCRTKDVIKYSAFLSTGENSESVKPHFKNVALHETPALLKIYCPPGTAIAPFEHDQTSSTEKELLLGRDLKFGVEDEKVVIDRNMINYYMDPDIAADFDQLYLITLRLHLAKNACI